MIYFLDHFIKPFTQQQYILSLIRFFKIHILRVMQFKALWLADALTRWTHFVYFQNRTIIHFHKFFSWFTFLFSSLLAFKLLLSLKLLTLSIYGFIILRNECIEIQRIFRRSNFFIWNHLQVKIVWKITLCVSSITK